MRIHKGIHISTFLLEKAETKMIAIHTVKAELTSHKHSVPIFINRTRFNIDTYFNILNNLELLDLFRKYGSLDVISKLYGAGKIGVVDLNEKQLHYYSLEDLTKFIISYYIIWVKEYFNKHNTRPDLNDPDNPIGFDYIHTNTECYELIKGYFERELNYQKSSYNYTERLLKGEIDG